MNRNSFFVSLVVVVSVCWAILQCTPVQRGIVRTVVDVIEDVCKESTTPKACLDKATAAMSSQPGFDAPPAPSAPSAQPSK